MKRLPHAPESHYWPRIDRERCDRCGECVSACPRHLIRMAVHWQINWLDCGGCGNCVAACRRDALRVLSLAPAPAREEKVLYFAERAPGNVALAVAALAARFRRGGVDAVVVASLTGSTAVLAARALAGAPHRLVCVADTPDWVPHGHPYPTLNARHHQELLERGAQVLRDYRSSSAGAPRFDPIAGGDVAMSAAEAALFWEGVSAVGGEGLKTAVKSVVLAADYGLVQRGESVLCLGGTGGREAAALVDALGHADIFAGASGARLRIREVLCLPA